MDVEACSTCDRLTPVRARCGCCQRVLCDACAHVEVGAIWCGSCLDNADAFVLETVLGNFLKPVHVRLEPLEF